MKALGLILLCLMVAFALGAAATITRDEFDRLRMDVRLLEANQELLRGRIANIVARLAGPKPQPPPRVGKRLTLQQLGQAVKKAITRETTKTSVNTISRRDRCVKLRQTLTGVYVHGTATVIDVMKGDDKKYRIAARYQTKILRPPSGYARPQRRRYRNISFDLALLTDDARAARLERKAPCSFSGIIAPADPKELYGNNYELLVTKLIIHCQNVAPVTGSERGARKAPPPQTHPRQSLRPRPVQPHHP